MTAPALNASVLAQASVHVTETALVFTDPDLPYDTYEQLGAFIGRIDDASSFWLGDWILFGEKAYKDDRYAQAAEATGLSPQRLMNVSSTCSRVPRSVRRAGLKFSHHEVVAKLEPAEQRQWLQIADEQGWSRRRLFEAINGAPEPPPAAADGRLTVDVARDLVRRAKPSGDPAWWLVPREAVVQLRSALGEHDGAAE